MKEIQQRIEDRMYYLKMTKAATARDLKMSRMTFYNKLYHGFPWRRLELLVLARLLKLDINALLQDSRDNETLLQALHYKKFKIKYKYKTMSNDIMIKLLALTEEGLNIKLADIKYFWHIEEIILYKRYLNRHISSFFHTTEHINTLQGKLVNGIKQAKNRMG